MKAVLWSFAITTVLGVIISLTVVHIGNSNPDGFPPTQPSTLDLDKSFVEQFADRTKWLETLAYAALVGMIGLRWTHENVLKHRTVGIACGALAVSLFNGYRAHDQILQALQFHAPLMLAGRVSRLTVICQFWFLALAITLLAARILAIAPRSASHAKALLLCMLSVSSVLASAQTPTPAAATDQKACAKEWVRSRFGQTPTDTDVDMLMTIVNGTAREKKINTAKLSTCDFTNVVLDYVANNSYTLNGDRDYIKFRDFAVDVARASSKLGFSDSSFVQALWSMAEIWHQPRGVLRVGSETPGDEVLVDSIRVGLTPLVCALRPGKHRLEIIHKGKSNLKEEIEVHDGEEILRSSN